MASCTPSAALHHCWLMRDESHCRALQQQMLEANGWGGHKGWAFGLQFQQPSATTIQIHSARSARPSSAATCRVVQQQILDANGWEGHKGWAFGLGLERLAMVKFQIDDIRLFWSSDQRFLSQFRAGNLGAKFKLYSKYPPVFKVAPRLCCASTACTEGLCLTLAAEQRHVLLY